MYRSQTLLLEGQYSPNPLSFSVTIHVLLAAKRIRIVKRVILFSLPAKPLNESICALVSCFNTSCIVILISSSSSGITSMLCPPRSRAPLPLQASHLARLRHGTPGAIHCRLSYLHPGKGIVPASLPLPVPLQHSRLLL